MLLGRDRRGSAGPRHVITRRQGRHGDVDAATCLVDWSPCAHRERSKLRTRAAKPVGSGEQVESAAPTTTHVALHCALRGSRRFPARPPPCLRGCASWRRGSAIRAEPHPFHSKEPDDRTDLQRRGGRPCRSCWVRSGAAAAARPVVESGASADDRSSRSRRSLAVRRSRWTAAGAAPEPRTRGTVDVRPASGCCGSGRRQPTA